MKNDSFRSLVHMAVRVLHLSSERTWRGGEQQIAYLIEEQNEHGLDVHIAVKSGSEFEKYCQTKKLPHHTLPFSNSMDFKTAIGIKQLVRKIKPDIIHMHSSKSHGVGVLSAMLGNKVPLILSRRVDFVPKNSWITRFKYNHSSIKKILCVSDTINKIMRSYIRDPEKCITVYSGIDPEKFNFPAQENILKKEFGLDEQTIIIGNTSALEAHKDYYTFLDTIEILVHSKLPVKGFIIGAGSLETKLKEYTREKNLADKVIFTGFRKDILQVLPALDIFLITSNEEGLGTSVLDAFAAGVPVVGTIAGGIPEMVKHSITGMLAPVRNSKGLATAIQEIIKNNSLRNALIKNAREKVKEFSKKATAEKTIAAYLGVIREKSQD